MFLDEAGLISSTPQREESSWLQRSFSSGLLLGIKSRGVTVMLTDGRIKDFLFQETQKLFFSRCQNQTSSSEEEGIL